MTSSASAAASWLISVVSGEEMNCGGIDHDGPALEDRPSGLAVSGANALSVSAAEITSTAVRSGGTLRNLSTVLETDQLMLLDTAKTPYLPCFAAKGTCNIVGGVRAL
jgi:hypothetical protein